MKNFSVTGGFRFFGSYLVYSLIRLGHLILVKNPLHHLKDDFCLSNDGGIFIDSGKPKYTFIGIGLLSPKNF